MCVKTEAHIHCLWDLLRKLRGSDFLMQTRWMHNPVRLPCVGGHVGGDWVSLSQSVLNSLREIATGILVTSGMVFQHIRDAFRINLRWGMETKSGASVCFCCEQLRCQISERSGFNRGESMWIIYPNARQFRCTYQACPANTGFFLWTLSSRLLSVSWRAFRKSVGYITRVIRDGRVLRPWDDVTAGRATAAYPPPPAASPELPQGVPSSIVALICPSMSHPSSLVASTPSSQSMAQIQGSICHLLTSVHPIIPQSMSAFIFMGNVRERTFKTRGLLIWAPDWDTCSY